VLQPTLGDGWISRWTRQHTVTVALAIAVVLSWALVVYKVFREGRRLFPKLIGMMQEAGAKARAEALL
jgi:hypothetical protein